MNEFAAERARRGGKSLFNDLVLTSRLMKMRKGQTFAVASLGCTIYFKCIKVQENKIKKKMKCPDCGSENIHSLTDETGICMNIHCNTYLFRWTYRILTNRRSKINEG